MRFNESRMNKALLKSMLNESSERMITVGELKKNADAFHDEYNRKREAEKKSAPPKEEKTVDPAKPDYRNFESYEKCKFVKTVKHKDFDISVYTVRYVDDDGSYWNEREIVITKDGKIPEGFKEWYSAFNNGAESTADAVKYGKAVIAANGEEVENW